MQSIPEMITKKNEERKENPNIHGIVTITPDATALRFCEWSLSTLLDGDRLGQIPWEVDVQISKDSKPVGDEL